MRTRSPITMTGPGSSSRGTMSHEPGPMSTSDPIEMRSALPTRNGSRMRVRAPKLANPDEAIHENAASLARCMSNSNSRPFTSALPRRRSRRTAPRAGVRSPRGSIIGRLASPSSVAAADAAAGSPGRLFTRR